MFFLHFFGKKIKNTCHRHLIRSNFQFSRNQESSDRYDIFGEHSIHLNHIFENFPHFINFCVVSFKLDMAQANRLVENMLQLQFVKQKRNAQRLIKHTLVRYIFFFIFIIFLLSSNKGDQIFNLH